MSQCEHVEVISTHKGLVLHRLHQSSAAQDCINANSGGRQYHKSTSFEDELGAM